MFKLLVFLRKGHNLFFKNKIKPSYPPFLKMSILALRHLMDVAHGKEHVVAGGTSGHVGAPLHHPCPLDHKGTHSPFWQVPALPWVLRTEDLASSCTSLGPLDRGPPPPPPRPNPNLFFGNFFLFKKERDLHVPECHCRIRGQQTSDVTNSE